VIALILRAIPEETNGPERIGRVAFLLMPAWFVVGQHRPGSSVVERSR
jgi:hypothetical protein